MKAARRLPAETFKVTLSGGHRVYMSLGYSPESGELREVAFVGKKKSDENGALDNLLHELGVYLSRAIQDRDPETGDEIEHK